MSSYTKLSSSLIASSVWNEPDKVRIVWITMLAMADQNGDVKAAVPGLAHLARETVNDTEHALTVLAGPDPNSGRKEMDGRRIIPIEGGWHLVTHEFYRQLGMSEETRKYWRERQRISRTSRTVKDKTEMSRKRGYVLASDNGVVLNKRKRIVKEKPTQTQVEDYAAEIGQPRSDGTGMFLHFEEKGWPKSWRLTIQKWKSFGYLPSQKQPAHRFQQPKMPAPTGEAYRMIPPARKVSDEELAHQRQIAREATETLRAKLKP